MSRYLNLLISIVLLLASPFCSAIQSNNDGPAQSLAKALDYAEKVENLARQEPELALKITIDALLYFDSNPDPVAKGRVLNGASYALSLTGDYPQSMEKAKAAESLAIQYNLADILARSQMLQGNILKRIGEYTRAINQYSKAVRHYQLVKNELYVGYCYNNMANTYYSAGLYSSALDYYQRYQKISNEGASNKGIGDTLLILGETDEALVYLKQALELYRVANDEFGVSLAINSLGDAYLATEEYRLALASFEEAIILAEKLKQNYSLEYSLRGKAKAYLASGDLDAALKWSQRAMVVAQERDEKKAILANLELKSQIYKDQGKAAQALEALQNLRDLEEKYESEQNSLQLVVMQALFESESKTAEITKLEEKNKLLKLEKQVEESKSRSAIFTSIVLIIALLSFSFWIYYVTREKSRISKFSMELEKAKATAEHATKTKSAFLANMSHEIRTPLTSIIGYADSILQGDIPEAEEHRVIKIISENGNHLLNVISDILDFTKIEANKLEFEFIPTPLFPLFKQIESVTGKRARDKGLSFELHFRYPLPNVVVTDPTRLRQILFNLSNNALKFTQKGSISLSVKAIASYLSIAIRDTGIGITKENQKGLFTPFTQADGSINRRFGGSGLGLSISQHLAHGLGGQIDFFSEEGKGSEFIVTIALKEAADCKWVDSPDEFKNETPLNAPKEQKNELNGFQGAKVLLAEDHPNNRDLITMMLKRFKLDVTAVENGMQATNAALNTHFDLIFLDIQMPVMDGIQALKQIREVHPHTPIIALTANNMKHEIELYLNEGFNDHLPKPLPREALMDKLDKFLEHFSDEHHQPNHTEQQPVIQAPRPPEKQQMVDLLRDYITHLQEDIEQALMCWHNQNWSELLKLAHSIKGSAGGFGFTNVGLEFKEIEQYVKDEKYELIGKSLDKTIGEIQYYVNMPSVDLPVGLYNSHQNIDDWHNKLTSVIAESPHIIEKLQLGIQQNGLECMTLLNDLKHKLTDIGITTATDHCHQIISAIRTGSEQELAPEYIEKLKKDFVEIKEYIRN